MSTGNSGDRATPVGVTRNFARRRESRIFRPGASPRCAGCNPAIRVARRTSCVAAMLGKRANCNSRTRVAHSGYGVNAAGVIRSNFDPGPPEEPDALLSGDSASDEHRGCPAKRRVRRPRGTFHARHVGSKSAAHRLEPGRRPNAEMGSQILAGHPTDGGQPHRP